MLVSSRILVKYRFRILNFPYITRIWFSVLWSYGFAEYTGLNMPVYEVFHIFSIYHKYMESRTYPYSNTFSAVYVGLLLLQCDSINDKSYIPQASNMQNTFLPFSLFIIKGQRHWWWWWWIQHLAVVLILLVEVRLIQ